MNEYLSTLTSLVSVITILILLYKVRAENNKLISEKKKNDSDTDKTHAETYSILSDELKEAYLEIKELRKNQDNIICHLDYEAHLLHCIRLVIARLVSLDIKPPCEPMSFEEFMKERKAEKNVTK